MNIVKIKQLMKEKKLTLYRLAKLTNITETELGKIIDGTIKDPYINTAKKIAEVLEIDIDEII